tara:strand:- start:562 stop:1017 length:456 start_codon:yes stop_codon:yes gene_type:complete
VASFISEIIARAVDPAVALREQLRLTGAPEFVGITDDGGRRPQDLGQPKGGGKGKGKGNPSLGKGKGAPGAPRYTCCSVTAAEGGPLCKHAHPPPCWRDPRVAVEIPAKLCKNDGLMKDLNKDRLFNANKLSVTCLPVQCGSELRASPPSK